MDPKFLQGAQPRCARLHATGTRWCGQQHRPPLTSRVRDNPEAAIPGHIWALPAEITNRSDRFRRTSAAPDILRRAGRLYLCRR